MQKALQASYKDTCSTKCRKREALTREYNTLQVNVRKIHFCLPRTANGKQIISTKPPCVDTDHVIFPEDIEEYFNQGLLSQPRLSGFHSSQTVPKFTTVSSGSYSETENDNIQVVPDVLSKNVKVAQNGSNRLSVNKTRGITRQCTKNSMSKNLAIASKIYFQDSKCNSKKSCISSGFVIPETPKLKIKQHDKHSQLRNVDGSGNTLAFVPETPLLIYSDDGELSSNYF